MHLTAGTPGNTAAALVGLEILFGTIRNNVLVILLPIYWPKFPFQNSGGLRIIKPGLNMAIQIRTSLPFHIYLKR